jgi:hypothetical protein
MTEPLRPMTLGEILDRTFQIYRARFWVFVGIAVIPVLVMTGLQIANDGWWKIRPGYSIKLFFGLTAFQLLFMLGNYHISSLLHILVLPSYCESATSCYFDEKSTMRFALSAPAKRWRSGLWMTALVWGSVLILPEIVTAAIFVGIVAAASAITKDSPAMDMIAVVAIDACILLGWIAVLWMRGIFAFIAPVWTVEKLPPWRSLRRSWSLSKGSRFRVAFTSFIPSFVGWIAIALLVQLFFFLLITAFRWSGHLWVYYRFAVTSTQLAITALVSALVGPIFPIALTLFYYDQRIRLEGYDIERMMSAAGLHVPEVRGDAVVATAATEEQTA